MRRGMFGFVFLVTCARMLDAQQPVPVSAEPRHHFKFENRYVRVYDVVVPAGDTTFFHIHALDYTYVSIGAANLVAQALGSEPTPLVLADAEVRFTKGPLTHRVWNVGSSPFHNLTIELLPHDAARGPLPAVTPGDSVVFDNERVRVVRRTIAPQRTTNISPRVPALTVLLAPGRVIVTGSAASSTEVKAGTYFWSSPRDRRRTLQNDGPDPLVMLTFMMK